MCSRSFGREVHRYPELREAVLTYISRAAEKLRGEESVAAAVQVFIQTNPFKDVPQYSRSVTVALTSASDDTLSLARAAVHGLQAIYKPGFAYKKAGTKLTGLSPKATRQINLFDDVEMLSRRDRLNTALDGVNLRFGRDTLRLAGAGVSRGWRMQRQRLSPAYTTDWQSLPVVR